MHTSLNSAPPAGLMAQAVLDMLSRAERVMDVDPRQARVFIGEVSRLLEPMSVTAAEPEALGLTPWQERKVMRHIGEHPDRLISVQALADLVGLSVGYFSRRFKASFGVSPRDYMIRDRLERAKALMRGTASPLCQIALDCGFCDQAHMSRTFRAVMGATPNRWRREQASALAA